LTDPRLERWLDALVQTPGLTSIKDRRQARRVLLEGSLAAVSHVRRFHGRVVDVGSGGGVPGVPLAVALPEREIVLLESAERKCRFLEDATRDIPNAEVWRGRAEEHALGGYGVAVARALAPPPVAAEWCLPLVASGGAVVLYVGRNVDLAALARVSERVGGGTPETHPGLIVIPKVTQTPPGFPRRPGMARKRPL
jgi:16S rRNA (guanine527-N7)-methyltransferase